MAKPSFDLYQEVTDRIIEMLEQGVAPWRSPIMGTGSAGYPKNLTSGKPYRGVNVFLLAFTAWSQGYGSSCWLTFNQAKSKGGSIRKGEKSSKVVFWKQYEIEDTETGKPKLVPVLRSYRVFNAEQCDGIEVPDAVPFEPLEFTPMEACEQIITEYKNGPTIEHGGTRAFYRPSTDAVRVPESTRFSSSEEYYGTLFHELAHSTGHSSRLDRGLDTEPTAFGAPDYGKEELVAEIASAFLCAEAGIDPVTIKNSAAYLQGWLRCLKQDKKLVMQAAGAGQKAADWIVGRTFGE